MFKTVAILASLVGGKYISIIVVYCLCLFHIVYYVYIYSWNINVLNHIILINC